MRNLIKSWNLLTPLTQKIVKFTLINGAIFLTNFILAVFLASWKDTGTSHIQASGFKANADSWLPMITAFDYIHSDHQVPVYEKMFFEEKVKFQYPPTSLLFIYLLKFIDPVLRNMGISWFEYSNWVNILNFVSFLFFVAMVPFVIRILNLSLAKNVDNTHLNDLNAVSENPPSASTEEDKSLSPQSDEQENTVFLHKKGLSDKPTKIDSRVRNISLICLILMFYPLIKAYTLGQIQVWINSLFAIAFWCWMEEKKATSGVIAGVLCLMKPQYLLFFVWGLLRQQWRFILAFTITSTSIGGLSLLLFGLAEHLNYLSVLSFISKHGESFCANQSVNGLLNRLLFNGNNLQWLPDAFAPFNIWVYLGTTITSVILIGMALLPPKKARNKADIIDFSIIAITCTMASPVAWEHHYGVLFPIFCYVFSWTLLRKPQTSLIRTLPYLCVSYVLASQHFGIFNKLASIPILNIMQSSVFLGAVMLLLSLYNLRKYYLKS